MACFEHGRWLAACAFAIVAPAFLAFAGPAQELEQEVEELTARSRILPAVGTGVRALRRDAAGRFYVLRAPASAVEIYGADGKLAGTIPPKPDKTSSLVYGEDLDLDHSGRVYVADRGGNSVRVYDSAGSSVAVISVPAPTSVAVLPGGELAVATSHSEGLVSVYNLQGKLLRQFGDPSEVAERGELNRYLNIGRLVSDADGHLYYAFSYLPEPAVRKFDRFGYARFEITLDTIDFLTQARAARREISRLEEGGRIAFKLTLDAVGVDPASEKIWIAVGDKLLAFTPEGLRGRTWRLYTPDGVGLTPTDILIEPDRILVTSDTLGIYDFARPDKPAPGP